jgi:beta-xylosidase
MPSWLGASLWPPFLQSIHIQELTPDFLSTTGEAYHVISYGNIVDFEDDTPNIFTRSDSFYVTASNTCGVCTGTLLLLFRSKSIQGP